MKRLLPVAVAVTAATIGLAGCNAGQGTRTDPPPTPTKSGAAAPSESPSKRSDVPVDTSDVCRLVPKADVAAVVHAQLTTAKPSTKEGERICDYDNSAGTGGITIGLSDTTPGAFDSDAQSYPPVQGPALGFVRPEER